MPRPSLRLIALAVAAMIAVCQLVIAPAGGAPRTSFTGVDGGSLANSWAKAAKAPLEYDSIHSDLAVPIKMSDGVTLKADVFRPANRNLPATGKKPVIVQFQGYGKGPMNLGGAILNIPGVREWLLPAISSVSFPKSTGLSGITDLTEQLDSGILPGTTGDFDLVKSGYVMVHVDIRGTGTSEGLWQMFGERERKDSNEVFDWINRQAWSDGNIGVFGTSFTGITAMRAAAIGGDKVKAAFTLVPSGDVFNDIAGQGGAVGVGFLLPWLVGVAFTKMVPDIESLLAGKFDPAQQLQWLKDRIADPLTFVDVVASLYGSLTTDDFSTRTKQFLDRNGPYRPTLEYDPRAVTAPTFTVSAASDIFAANQLVTYNKSPLPQTKKKLLFGDAYHALIGAQNFGEPGYPPKYDVLQRAWFDHWLKGVDNGIEKYSPVSIKQPGGTGWSALPSWPRPDAVYQRMYLNDTRSGTAPTALFDGGLSATEKPRRRDLTVAPGLASICSRDSSIIWAGIPSIVVACAEDSRVREREGLTFTGAPVKERTIVSGAINVHLNAVHDTKDGYWTVTVNDVAPNGWSRQISTGQLVSSLREIDDSRSTRLANGDYITAVPFLDFDRRQLTKPGVPVALDISSSPVDAVLQPGHRLRVDVFASNFPKGLPPTPILVDSKLAPQHLRLDPSAPSWVSVPLTVPMK